VKIACTCVKVVASAITKGTFTNLARVFASSVFPVLTGKESYMSEPL